MDFRRAESYVEGGGKNAEGVRRASFAQLLCTAEDKQQRRRLARSSLKSWEKKVAWYGASQGGEKNETTGESNPRPFPSVSTLLRAPPPPKNEWKTRQPGWRWQKLHASKNAERKRKIHTRDPFLFFLPFPVSTFNRGRVRAHTRRRAIFFREPGIPFHGVEIYSSAQLLKSHPAPSWRGWQPRVLPIHPFSPLSLPCSRCSPAPAGNSGAYFIYEAGGRIDNLQRRYVNAASRTRAVPLFLPPWRRMGGREMGMMEENRERTKGRGESFVGRRSFGKMQRNRPDPGPPLRGNASLFQPTLF